MEDADGGAPGVLSACALAHLQRLSDGVKEGRESLTSSSSFGGQLHRSALLSVTSGFVADSGGELEFVDGGTLAHAIEGRKQL